MNDPTALCRDTLIRGDYDRYILSMAAPAAVRPDLWALYAFNHDIARVRDSISDPRAGHLRLAWWHETLAAFYAGTPLPAQGIAPALGLAITKHSLPLDLFDMLLHARHDEVDGQPPVDVSAMAAHAQAANTPLLQLAARIVGADELDAGLQALGRAYGLCGVARALPFYARGNYCPLPPALVYEIGLMPEQFHHLAPSQKLNDVVEKIALAARDYLRGYTPAHPLFSAHKNMVAFYLRRLARAGFNPFDAAIARPVPFLGLRLRLKRYDQ